MLKIKSWNCTLHLKKLQQKPISLWWHVFIHRNLLLIIHRPDLQASNTSADLGRLLSRRLLSNFLETRHELIAQKCKPCCLCWLDAITIKFHDQPTKQGLYLLSHKQVEPPPQKNRPPFCFYQMKPGGSLNWGCGGNSLKGGDKTRKTWRAFAYKACLPAAMSGGPRWQKDDFKTSVNYVSVSEQEK